LHGPLKKNNKNSEKKIKFGFFRVFRKILEGVQLEFRNFTGGLFSQKKEILTPKKFGDPPWPPGGAFLRVGGDV
jgi:hypothetical protein